MLLSKYLGIGYKLDEYGVFDPILDKDSNFFINLQRLKKTEIPEFAGSYEKIHDYFRKIIKLLDKASSKDRRDIFFKQALAMFSFSEVNGICLGYAKGSNGAGFGEVLSAQVISTAYDIVKAGVEDPEFFELLPLFQDNVGADRLSDMIATLILEDIKSYTRRVNRELKIDQAHFQDFRFIGDILINPYKQDEVLLVPVEILHKLPVAEIWEDIDNVVSQNTILRAEMNSEVANEWKQYTVTERKSYLCREVFKRQDSCKRVLEGYREEELGPFNPQGELQYLLQKLEQCIDSLDMNWSVQHKDVDSLTCALDIMELFKQWVELHKGWKIIRETESRKKEKVLQRMIDLIGMSYRKANNLDISCEPDEGRGPVDFKLSRGQDITVIEVKLSTNKQYLHGYETQILEYAKAEATDKMIYVIVDLGHPGKIERLQQLHDRKYDEGENPPLLIVIDAKEQISASRA